MVLATVSVIFPTLVSEVFRSAPKHCTPASAISRKCAKFNQKVMLLNNHVCMVLWEWVVASLNGFAQGRHSFRFSKRGFQFWWDSLVSARWLVSLNERERVYEERLICGPYRERRYTTFRYSFSSQHTCTMHRFDAHGEMKDCSATQPLHMRRSSLRTFAYVTPHAWKNY